MVLNGPKRFPNVSEMLIYNPGSVPNGPFWSLLVLNGPKWYPMVLNSPFVVLNSPEWSQMVPIFPNGPEESLMVANGPERSQMVSNHSEWSQLVPNGLIWSRIGLNWSELVWIGAK